MPVFDLFFSFRWKSPASAADVRPLSLLPPLFRHCGQVFSRSVTVTDQVPPDRQFQSMVLMARVTVVPSSYRVLTMKGPLSGFSPTLTPDIR